RRHRLTPYHHTTLFRSLPNNLIARNKADAASANTETCVVDGSLVTDDVALLDFVSPDAEPYDYHIGAASTARDSATVESLVREEDRKSTRLNSSHVKNS